MTCDEYTRLLMTRSWTELNEGEAHEHASTCARCSELRQLTETAETRLGLALSAARSSLHPSVLADRAIIGARLRSLERGLLVIPILLVALIIWMGIRGLPPSTVEILTGRRALPPLTTETIALRCLSVEQARSLARPYLGSDEAVIAGSSGSIRTLTVRGTAHAVNQAKDVLKRFESDPNAACRRP